MPSSLSAQRFWVAIFFIASLFFLVIYQLFQLTVIRRPTLLQLADKQSHITIDIPPLRGQIVDRHDKEFATNLKAPSIYAIPRLIAARERERVAAKLSDMLDLDFPVVLDRLSKDKSFVWPQF